MGEAGKLDGARKCSGKNLEQSLQLPDYQMECGFVGSGHVCRALGTHQCSGHVHRAPDTHQGSGHVHTAPGTQQCSGHVHRALNIHQGSGHVRREPGTRQGTGHTPEESAVLWGVRSRANMSSFHCALESREDAM